MSDGQEREALKEIEKIYGEGRKPPTLVERRIHEIARAALAAREEPQEPTKLGDAVRQVCNEWVHENGVGPTSDWHVQRLLPLADRIDAALAAREDTERPERCWTLVSGEEGELPVVEAGPMLVREEVRVREDAERPDEER